MRIWLRTAPGLGRPCTYERTCVFICACECGTHVYSTRTGPGHGCVLPTGRCTARIHTGACALHFRVCTCGTVFGLGSASSVFCMCMCVCTAVGMCSPSVVPLVVNTCMRALYSIWHGDLGGVRSIDECCLYVCTVRVPLEQCFGVASTGDVPILPVLVLVLACIMAQCVLCLYPLYSVLGWPARAMYLSCPCLYPYCVCTIAQCVLSLYPLYSVLACPTRAVYLSCPCLYSYHCTVCTMLVPLVQCFSIAITGNVPILPVFCPCLYSYHCTVCTVLVPLVQCFGMASTGNVSILPVLVLVMYVYHCTVCTVLVPLVQCFGTASTGNVPILPVVALVRTYCACTVVLCLYSCTVF